MFSTFLFQKKPVGVNGGRHRSFPQDARASRDLALGGPLPSTEAGPQLKTTPIRFSFHHTTRQGMRCLFARRTRVKWSGIPTGVTTSSIAPVSDILRTMQVIALPPNSIVPAFKTRLRGDARLSMDVLSGGTLIPKRSQKIRDLRIQPRTLALNTASLAVRFLERPCIRRAIFNSNPLPTHAAPPCSTGSSI